MSRMLILLLPSLLLVGACSGLVDSIKSTFGTPPTAQIRDVRIGGVDLQSVTLDFDIEVINPYSFALPLVGLDYALSTNTQPFLGGAAELEGSIPAEGMRTISVPLRVNFAGLFDTVTGLRPGQVIPYDAQLTLNLDVPGAEPLGLPLNKSGDLPIPTPPQVSIASLDWDSVSPTEVTGTLLLDIINPNEFAFTLKSLEYDLDLAGHSIANGEVARTLWMSAGAESQFSMPLSFSPGSAGMALLGMLGGTQIDYAVAGSLEIETPFGMISMPYEHDGRAAQHQ